MLPHSLKLSLVMVSLLFSFSQLRAADLPDSFTFDVPLANNAATPLWLGHPEVPATSFASLNLPIHPPDSTSSLLVTIFFIEKPDGFLRLTWNGGQAAQTLSSNFYEGIGMANQRSLLIPPSVLQQDGVLTLQSSDTNLGVQRIRMQWLGNRDSLVGFDVDDLLVTPSPGTTEPAQDLSGQPPTTASPVWHGQLVNVPLTDSPQRIEQGVDFSVQIDNAPLAGRLAFKENGLPWGEHLVLWVNRQRAATVTPALPNLADDGYWSDPASSAVYIGWRDSAAFVPVALFKTGVNIIQLSVESDVGSQNPTSNSPPPTALALAVKDMVLQLASARSGEDATPSSPDAATSSAESTNLSPLVTNPGINPP